MSMDGYIAGSRRRQARARDTAPMPVARLPLLLTVTTFALFVTGNVLGWVQRELLAVVHATVQPSHAELWLRTDSEERRWSASPTAIT
jgi:hypothetical protein